MNASITEYRIAVVDDDQHIRHLVEMYLRKEGYETVGLETAEDALELWRTSPPDLWVLDIMLPGMDGYELWQTNPQRSGGAYYYDFGQGHGGR